MKFLSLGDLLQRGWTRSMVRDLLGNPDSTERFRTQYGCKVTRYNYGVTRIRRAERTKLFAVLRRAAERRASARTPEAMARRAQARTTRFMARYGSQEAAIADACEALLSLNRYAKHASCSRDHRDEIYSLKTDLLYLLIDRKLLAKALIHKTPTERCDRCGGSGHYYTDTYNRLESQGRWNHPYLEEYDATCRRCNGSGKRKGRTYYLLHFVIGNRFYSWHTPQDEFDRDVTLTDEGTISYDGAEIKPLEMPRSRFALAKALIRWVLDQERQPRNEPRSME